jgi:hypothetical protein
MELYNACISNACCMGVVVMADLTLLGRTICVHPVGQSLLDDQREPRTPARVNRQTRIL